MVKSTNYEAPFQCNFLFSCLFIPLMSEYYPKHLVLKHNQVAHPKTKDNIAVFFNYL